MEHHEVTAWKSRCRGHGQQPIGQHGVRLLKHEQLTTWATRLQVGRASKHGELLVFGQVEVRDTPFVAHLLQLSGLVGAADQGVLFPRPGRGC